MCAQILELQGRLRGLDDSIARKVRLITNLLPTGGEGGSLPSSPFLVAHLRAAVPPEASGAVIP